MEVEGEGQLVTTVHSTANENKESFLSDENIPKTGELAQGLSVPPVLPKDLGSILSTRTAAHSSRGSGTYT